jgi:hypothetical protein
VGGVRSPSKEPLFLFLASVIVPLFALEYQRAPPVSPASCRKTPVPVGSERSKVPAA